MGNVCQGPVPRDESDELTDPVVPASPDPPKTVDAASAAKSADANANANGANSSPNPAANQMPEKDAKKEAPGPSFSSQAVREKER